MEESFQTKEPLYKRSFSRWYVFTGCICAVFVLFWMTALSAPAFEKPILVHIYKGESIAKIAQELHDRNIVRSPRLLQSLVSFLGADSQINIGDYYFDRAYSLPRVAFMLARGIHNIKPIKITFPEGTTNIEMAAILSAKIPEFNSVSFTDKAQNMQGELFPDTYFFYPLTTPDEIIAVLHNTFEAKTKNIFLKGYKNYTKKQIETMASIIEKEAKGKSDANIIAGILWKRLENGIALQVDAAPVTYKVKGLPADPIANFGLVSLQATVDPEVTAYLFYLHDKNGMIHTAITYTEHKKNINRYLK